MKASVAKTDEHEWDYISYLECGRYGYLNTVNKIRLTFITLIIADKDHFAIVWVKHNRIFTLIGSKSLCVWQRNASNGPWKVIVNIEKNKFLKWLTNCLHYTAKLSVVMCRKVLQSSPSLWYWTFVFSEFIFASIQIYKCKILFDSVF